jgi:class 3 adenylate cyclase
MAETRKLAAILAADVVDYSPLAGSDEDRILARLRALRSDLVDPTVALHNGGVVKRTGDDIITEFCNVVDAVLRDPLQVGGKRGRALIQVGNRHAGGPCVPAGRVLGEIRR